MAASNDYSFQTRWRIEATREEVFALIDDVAGYPRWWPAVWLKIDKVASGDENGVGATFQLLTKGWLPYLIRWQSRTTAKRFPERLALVAEGDFVGTGVWHFTQDGPFVDMVYDWNLRADKPLLRRLSFILKPIFSANHNWAMHKGLESLKLELARRRAGTDVERAKVPPPPPAVFWFGRPKELQNPTTIENFQSTAASRS
jgi:hypothetical protein